jgi:hypothetical protein
MGDIKLVFGYLCMMWGTLVSFTIVGIIIGLPVFLLGRKLVKEEREDKFKKCACGKKYLRMLLSVSIAGKKQIRQEKELKNRFKVLDLLPLIS